MAFTASVNTALRELISEDPLLHKAMIIALQACRDDADIYVYQRLLSVLQSYDRKDLVWGLDFMQDHPELNEFWGATVDRLDADQFHLYLDRLDDLWERITSLPGVTADTTWAVLTGYREKDPGTKRSHGTAAFMINAALLTSVNASALSPADSGVTTRVRYSAFAGDHLDELTPEMIGFAIERAADMDRIVDIILTENLWHPEALRYRLDGELVPVTPAEELAHPLIDNICDTSPDRLEHIMGSKHLGDAALGSHVSHTNSMILGLAEKAHENDLEYLQTYTRLIRDHSRPDAAFTSKTLDTIISDLRTLEAADLSVIDEGMTTRVGIMVSAINFNSVMDDDAVLRQDNEHWTEYRSALRTAAAIGPEPVQKYVEVDPKRAINIAVRHKALTHDALVRVLKEAASHGALTDGFL